MMVTVWEITHTDAYGIKTVVAERYLNEKKAIEAFKYHCNKGSWWGAKDTALIKNKYNIDIEDINNYLKGLN